MAKDAVLVDLGGPGYSVLGMNAIPRFRMNAFPRWMKGMTAVSLEEPWVTRPRSEGCRSASAHFYSKARSVLRSDAGGLHVRSDVAAMKETARGLVDACDLGKGHWGWEPEQFRAALQAIVKQKQLRLDGAVGVSFGAVRAKYVGNEIRKWIVLESPAPLGIDARRFLEGLNIGALTRLGQWESLGSSSAEQRLAEAARAFDERSERDDNRSIPTTGADVGPAAVALARVTDADFQQYAPDLLSNEPSGSVIGALSDRTWGRFRVSDVSPTLLAYFDEVCPRYQGWSEALDNARGSPLAAFLAVFHSPCGAIEGDAASPPKALPATRAQASCVISATRDPVTPLSSARAWAKRLSNSKLVTVDSDGHGSLNLDSCTYLKTYQYPERG